MSGLEIVSKSRSFGGEVRFLGHMTPSDVPWGRDAFTTYLGPDRAAWAEWDANAHHATALRA